VLGRGGDVRSGVSTTSQLYAMYARAGGDTRPMSSLHDEGVRRLGELREHGLDLGIDDAAASDARLDAIYANARAALYATVDDHVIKDAAVRPVHVRTAATSRDDYLSHPPTGERLRDDDARVVAGMYPTRRPHVQIVISDGLNANAVNEQFRVLLPELRRVLSSSGHHVGESVVLVQNGRVRVGYEIGGLTGATVIIHLLGERPGTGLNTLSAYVTYGLDGAGQLRWSRSLDHSVTTAICGIHPKGKAPMAAAREIASAVGRMIERRLSGVALAQRD
jgi:ethanolamine ammonia-lyase small subunit